MSKLAEQITDLSLKDDLDEAIDDAVSITGGNPWAAIGALIMGQKSLQETYAERISAGYVRLGSANDRRRTPHAAMARSLAAQTG